MDTDQFVIVTDSTSDLPGTFLASEKIVIIPLSFHLEGNNYQGDGDDLSPQEFYKIMRNGAMPSTSQINIDAATNALKPLLQAGKDLLYISFSSGLSGSYNSVKIASEELLKDFPDRKIIIIDSLAASLGHGLLVYRAALMKKQGKTLEEIAAWVTENMLSVCHYFTVDDLNHLHRGGRVSKTTAVVGTMLGIKPLLKVDNNGKLVPIDKIRGRKQSLNAIVDIMNDSFVPEKNDTVFISHGDCLEDAEYVASLIKQKYDIKNFIINFVGPIIGAHSGPGTVALFYIGKAR